MIDYTEQAADLMDMGRFSEAINCLNNVPEDDYKYFIAMEMKGRALMLMGRFNESIEAFDLSLEAYPDWASKDNLFASKGDTFSMMNKFPQAIECYENSLNINPDNEIALKGIGIALVIEKKYDDALNYLDKLLAISPNNAIAFSWKGEALEGLNKYDEALKEYDLSLACNPQDEDVIKLRQDLLIKLNRNPQETSEDWVERGSNAMIFSTVDNVLYCFDKAIEINPKNETAWIYKGNILFSLTNPDNSPNFKNIGDALDCYRIALELNPDNDEVYYYMSDAVLNLGQIEQALNYCLTGLQRCPNSDKLWAKQGVILLKLNRVADAQKCFEAALSINPDNFEANQYIQQM